MLHKKIKGAVKGAVKGVVNAGSPSLRQVGQAVKSVNPILGIRKVTKVLKRANPSRKHKVK